MTLDKAIKDLETEYKSDYNRQIAEWLKELKKFRGQQSEDTISRQETINYLNTNMVWYDEDGAIADSDEKLKAITDLINGVPPVTAQQPKTGHWIKVHPLQADDEGAYMCSCCEVGDWDLKGTEKFCPNCGARMVEPQEGGDKE